MKQPLVSVMISSYNQIEETKRAISSALSQDYSNLEIVVSDDATEADVISIWTEEFLQENVRFYQFEENVGRAANYRKLLSDFARGKYVTMLNADDYFKDNSWIRKGVEVLENDPEIAFAFGKIEILLSDTDKRFIDKYHDHLPEKVDGNEFFRNYIKGYSIPHVGNLYRRDEALALDFYRIDSMSQDWESFLRLLINRKIFLIKNVVAIKVQHGQNVTKKKELANFAENEHYIHSVYNFALESGAFKKKVLADWKEKMLIRHHTKWLVKIFYLQKEAEPDYQDFLKNEHPQIHRKINAGVKYQAFRIVRHFPWALRLIFRYVLKQESFIADMQAHKS